MTDRKLEEVKNYVKDKLEGIDDLQHGWGHARRVSRNAEKIVEILNLKELLDMNLLLAICYLHDINHATYLPGLLSYFFESGRSKKILTKVLGDLKIDDNEKDIIINSVSSSSFSFPFKKLNRDKDLYTQVLQDADTIDFFSGERMKSFEKAKRKILFYKLMSPFSSKAINYGRDNLGEFLNFQLLAKHFYV